MMDFIDDKKVVSKKKPKLKETQKRNKKSIFHIVPDKDMEVYGKMITLKQVSYDGLLKKLQKQYKELEKIKTSSSLRYYMITKKFVLNEKAYESINRNVEKTALAQNKQKRVINALKKNIFENEEFIIELFNNPLVKKQIIKIMKEQK